MSIYKAWKEGKLDDAIKLDVLQSKIMPYLKIYEEFEKQRTVGHNYTQAVTNTAEVLGIGESTVKRVIAYVM